MDERNPRLELVDIGLEMATLLKENRNFDPIEFDRLSNKYGRLLNQLIENQSGPYVEARRKLIRTGIALLYGKSLSGDFQEAVSFYESERDKLI